MITATHRFVQTLYPKVKHLRCGFIALLIVMMGRTPNIRAQDSIQISGEFENNTRYAKMVIQQFNVGSYPIAAVQIDKTTGEFSINVPKSDLEPGVYRFQYSQTNQEYVDVILNGEESKIHFSINAEAENKFPEFSHSEENKLWYTYKKEAGEIRFKIELLQQLLSNYPDTEDEVYIQNSKYYKILKDDYGSKQADFIASYPDTWACEMVGNAPSYFPNPRDDWRLKIYYQRQNFWKGIDTGNPDLINTPLYTELILQYIQYYLNPEMEFSDKGRIKGFKKSIDVIMQAFSAHPETEEFAYKYLSLGFKEIGQEEVLEYLDKTYAAIAEQCLEEQEKDAFEKRMAGYNAMAPGSKAPDIAFEMESENLKAENLYAIEAEQTLVVFWASWCPHCQEEMPNVENWAKQHPETQVVAISLDDDPKTYREAIKAYPNLMHHSDLKRWEGKAVKDYYIYGTPSFILLDEHKNIIGKYSAFSQVEEDL